MIHSDFLIFRPTIHPMVAQAARDVEILHNGQVRKYDGAPYWTHCREVAFILARVGIEDPEMLAAAYLHDVLEDTDCPPELLSTNYSPRVLDLVIDLTEVPTQGNRATRKGREAERLGGIHPDAKTIKCADLISNTLDIVANDPDFAKVYIPEKMRVLDFISGEADPVLAAWANRSVLEAQKALA